MTKRTAQKRMVSIVVAILWTVDGGGKRFWGMVLKRKKEKKFWGKWSWKTVLQESGRWMRLERKRRNGGERAYLLGNGSQTHNSKTRLLW